MKMNILALSANLTASIISFIVGDISAGFAWAACCCWNVALMSCERRRRKNKEAWAWIELFHDRAFVINLAPVMEKEQKESKPDDNHD